jgi:hypothetical protein
MAGNDQPSSWIFLATLALVAGSFDAGCEASKQPVHGLSEEAKAAIRHMLDDVWPEVVAPQLSQSAEAVADMNEALSAWATAELEDGDSETARLSAQGAWVTALQHWQAAEVMQLGPAGSSLTVLGGSDIRDEIYSWPLTNACKVDQVTASYESEADDFFESALVNSKGFDALETLLFSAPGSNDCSESVDINASGTWDALGPEATQLARAQYAARLGDHIAIDIARIESGWTEGFAEDLAGAGDEGSPFETQIEGVNAIFDALFYLETVTKDRKLGWPLGLTDCGQSSCTDQVETTTAGGSQLWLTANLRGFHLLFTGGNGVGMNDLLEIIGHGDTTEALLDALEQATATTDALDTGLDLVETSALEMAHADVGAITALLKSDVATALTLRIPSEAAGDND